MADTQNHTIRKIATAGAVGTFAGIVRSWGSADGTGAAARFAAPYGVAVDGSGSIYVADTVNHTIRKITPVGVVSTLAGTAGSSGSADGIGSAVRFDSPQAVAVDGSGNVYVADTNNHTIRKITPAGAVSTFAGTAGSSGSADGTGASVRFNRPGGVAGDGSGNVHVADTSDYTIRKITPAGVVSTLAGAVGFFGSADGTGVGARFNLPGGVAVDGSGSVYVADTYNSTIRKVTPGGTATTVLGVAGHIGVRLGADPRLNLPSGIAVVGSGRLAISSENSVLIATVP